MPRAGSPFIDQLLALRDRAHRHVGDEARTCAAHLLGVFRVFRRLDDAHADRFHAGVRTLQRDPHAGLAAHLRRLSRFRPRGSTASTSSRRNSWRLPAFPARSSAFAKLIMLLVLPLRGSALRRRPFLMSISCGHGVASGLRGRRSVLGTSLAGRQVAERAGDDAARVVAVGDDLRHRRMVVGIPIGRSDAVLSSRCSARPRTLLNVNCRFVLGEAQHLAVVIDEAAAWFPAAEPAEWHKPMPDSSGWRAARLGLVFSILTQSRSVHRTQHAHNAAQQNCSRKQFFHVRNPPEEHSAACVPQPSVLYQRDMGNIAGAAGLTRPVPGHESVRRSSPLSR